MYKISAFSRLGQVSIKALRLYDQKGLLKPAHVDTETNYRYYKVEQLSQLHRLLALKAMGFSLEQVGQLLSDEVSLTQMQAMLKLKQAELQQQLAEAQARVAAVDAHLKHIKEERTMPTYEVILKSVEAVSHVLSIREKIPTYTAVSQLFVEMMGYLAEQGGQPQAYAAAIWHDPSYKEVEVDAEAIMAAPSSVVGNDRLQIKDLPAIETVAAIIHRGTYSTLNQAYGAIMQWIEDNGYEVSGPNREVYLQGGAEQDNPNYVTEIQFPVKKVEAA